MVRAPSPQYYVSIESKQATKRTTLQAAEELSRSSQHHHQFFLLKIIKPVIHF